MAVASPYAVFRAVDVIWPPAPAPVVVEAVSPAAGCPRRPRKRRVVVEAVSPAAGCPRRPRKRRVVAAVQGELFPVKAWLPRV